jgi:glycosyltransferase involved in cell wall biosynthesis
MFIPKKLTINKLPPAPFGKTGWPWTEDSPELPETMPDGIPWPKISVVTPSFNQGKFIEETIRSVLLQGYPDLEYIIIDGNSTDNSAEIIKKYAQWLTFWVSEKDNGQSDAINKGWRRSSGEIVTYLNSDDLYTSAALAEVADHFRNHADCAVIHGQTVLTDEEGRNEGVFGGPFNLVASIDGCNDSVAQPSAFIRRKALLDVGLMDINLHRAMDYDLWLRLRVKYPFHYIPRCWSKFRCHPKSKSSGRIPLRSDSLSIMKKLYSTAGLPKEILDLKNRALAWANLFEAQMYTVTNRPFRARWHALVALTFNREVCFKSGKGLFVQTLLNEAMWARMRKINQRIKRSHSSSPARA